jgi:alkylation response protein AidB-like acyl-CoA dehydrogenase
MEALQEIQALAREFAREQLRPHTERWDHDGALDGDVVTHLAELGFFGMTVPEGHGGMDFDLATYAAALEALAWGEASVALTVELGTQVARLVLRHGDDGQKRRWLEGLAGGTILGCMAVADDDEGGSVRARRAGDGWLLDGERRWVTNADIAGVAVVRATVEEGGEGRLFLVPTDASGWSVAGRESTMGLRPVTVATVRLDGIRVEDEAVLDGTAEDALNNAASEGRVAMAAIACGIAQAALEHATSYAAERQQFGQPLRNFEGIQHKLADMAIRVAAARELTAAAAARPEAGITAMAKVFASESAMAVTTQAVQVFGGYGYMRDYPVEKLMRDAKATEIMEGPNELQRVLIAGELYRG